MQQDSWKLLDELDDPELRELASRLPCTVLHNHADSTAKKYLDAFRRWKAWAAIHKLSPLSARPHEFALYLQHLSEKTKSKAAVEEAANAVA